MKRAAKYILLAIFLNAALTSIIYRFKNPDKTETELFLNIPQSFIWNFNSV